MRHAIPWHPVAKTYAGLGWRLSIQLAKTRRPLLKEWQHKATSDHKTIDSWWKDHPDAMIGVACGPASTIAVVDVDNKPDENGVTGLQHFARLEKEDGELDVPTAKTPGGQFLRICFFSGTSLPFPPNESRIAPKVDLAVLAA